MSDTTIQTGRVNDSAQSVIGGSVGPVQPPKCTFDAEKHEYRRGDKVLPSVSQIITSVWPRTDGAPPGAIETARQRGSWVDAQFMHWLAGNDLNIPAGTDQGWVDALGQACDYWNEYRKGAKVECQIQLFSEHEAGTLDLLVEGDEILELKSTWEISKTVPAQLGGYGDLQQQAWEEIGLSDEQLALKCGVLHCHKRLKKANFKAIDYLTAWGEWRTVRNFYRLVNGVKT